MEILGTVNIKNKELPKQGAKWGFVTTIRNRKLSAKRSPVGTL